MNGQTLDVVAPAGAGWCHADPAIAAVRVGGIGVIDSEFCNEPDRARIDFDRLPAGDLAAAVDALAVSPTADRHCLWAEVGHRIAQGAHHPVSIVMAAGPDVGRAGLIATRRIDGAGRRQNTAQLKMPGYGAPA